MAPTWPQLGQLGLNLGPKIPPKSAPRPLPRATYVEKPKTLNFEYPPMVLLVFWGPRGCPGRPIFIKKCNFQATCFPRVFWNPFFTNIVQHKPKMSKIGRQLGPQGGGPRTLVFGVMLALGAKMGQDGPKSPQEPSKTPSWHHFGAILGPSWGCLAARWRLVGAAGG